MTSDASTLVMAGALAVATVLALASARSWQRARAGQRRHRVADMDASRTRADELLRRHRAGELTPEAFEAQQHAIAESLLQQRVDDGAASPDGRSRPLVLAAGALLVALAAGLFHAWTAPPASLAEAGRVAAAPPVAASEPGPRAHALSDAQLERMVEQSRQRLRDAPQDAAAWAMLAHSYDMLGKFAESSKAYATLARLEPRNAQVLADYADALAVANGRTLAGEPSVLVDKALAIDPRNVKALTLAGSAAFERRDFDAAIARWQAARDLSRDAHLASEIDASLAKARASAGGRALPAVALASAPPLAAASAVVTGRITLADDLQSQVPPDATLFVFARPVDGSRMPVAILRRHASDLPLDFRLDDSMAMVPDARLSRVASVVIGARISRRGDVTPQAGDIQGLSAPVSVGTHGVKLEISEVLR